MAYTHSLSQEGSAPAPVQTEGVACKQQYTREAYQGLTAWGHESVPGEAQHDPDTLVSQVHTEVALEAQAPRAHRQVEE